MSKFNNMKTSILIPATGIKITEENKSELELLNEDKLFSYDSPCVSTGDLEKKKSQNPALDVLRSLGSLEYLI